ncbi:MAG: response regulator [Deltaproteobacteria bacterium]|jgi:DNA-binding response OmpR family regulator|nr:response regulator [Deltaproteobacteria bacterium]
MPKKILVIDDERDLVETLKFRLDAAGYEVHAAYDGQEGLKKTRDVIPDLIILDVMMPALDGYQVCRMLKFDAKYEDIPIIMLTARGQDSDKATGGEVGADIYLTKPFESSVLMEKIKKLLDD